MATSTISFDKKIDRRKTHSYKWDVKRNEIPFTVADTDFEVAPEIRKAIVKRSKQSCYGYTFTPNNYFNAYIYWWEHRYNLKLNRGYFVYSTSVVASIDSIIKRVSDVGDRIALFSPNYNVFYNCILNNKRIVEEIPFDYSDYTYSIDWNKVEESIKKSKVFILCNPHNPTGHRFIKNELIKIGEICKKYGVYLISDEIHADFDYNKNRYIPFFSVFDYEKAIMLISPSKTFNVAGLHSSVAVIKDKKLRELIEKGFGEDDVGEPSYFSIEPVIAAFTKCDYYVKEMNDYISQNKRILSEFIVKNHINLKIIDGEMTYLVWMDVSSYTDDSDKFVKELKEQTGIILASGKNYHQHHSQFIRINIATQKDNILALCEGLKKYCLKGK